MPLVYDELKRLAAYYLRIEAGLASLASTAIVHEAYLRLVGGATPGLCFFTVASRVLRLPVDTGGKE